MSTASNRTKSESTHSAASREDLSQDLDALRGDFQKLSDTIARLTNQQIGHAQNRALDAAGEAEAAIRRNPLATLGIAVGLGFLVGIMSRR